MMADDPERDLIPIKDVKGSYGDPAITLQTASSEVFTYERPTLLEQKIAEQLSRNDLEDHLFHLREENLELKKTSRKQEDQLKKLATKMSRLMSEKKKQEANSSPGRKRDIEMEEAMEELHDKVRMLEKNNIQLREKLLVAKQQVISHARRPNAYHHIPPKVNSGRPRSGVSPYTIPTNARGTSAQNSQRKAPATPIPPYVMQLLDEARHELFNLKELVTTQKNEIDVYEQEVEILKERLQMKDTEYDEEMNLLKSQITEGQRQHVQENLDLIRLHRELKQKSSRLITLQAQIADMEERMKAQKISHDRLVNEIEDKTMHMREEQKKSLDLFAELQKNRAALLNLADLQESLKALKKENDVLKETNDKLINSVLSQEKERANNSAEQVLKEQLVYVESSLRSESNQKELLQKELETEKEKYHSLSEEHRKLQTNLSEVQEQMAELEAKVNILKSEEVDFEELGEAFALVKLKKQQSLNMNFLGNVVPDGEERDLKSKLKKFETEHGDTLKELSNVREMLMTQYKINKDAQAEIKALTEKFDQQEKEYQTKIEEYANLLDIRAARIQKLESQLNDVAYGTKKFKIKDYTENIDMYETLDLNRGENIFEVHLIKFVYSSGGLKALKNNDPSSFFTWNFYEFELQSTPVVKGRKPHFDCTSQYRVKVDDFLLFYMHKHSATFELHESLGTDYRTVAACQINFSEVFQQPHGRLHIEQEVISVSESAKGVIFGTIHCWVRFKVPMEEAFKLHKEKFKALKYIQSNQVTSSSALKLLSEPSQKDPSMNELHLKIIRCIDLKGRYEDVQPSPYCIYKFYDLPEQDTMIVPASNNPQFSDHRTFPVYMDADIEKYLRTQNLDVYVFDDTDPDFSSYIGKASVSLLPLSQDKPVKGLFELIKGDKINCGSVEVSMYWQYPYQRCSTVSLPNQLQKPIEYPNHIAPVVSVVTDFDEVSSINETSDGDYEDYSTKIVPVPKPRRRATVPKPLMSSTPLKDALSGSNSTTVSLTSQETTKPKSPTLSVSEPETVDKMAPRPAVRHSKLKPNDVDNGKIIQSTKQGPQVVGTRQKRSEALPKKVDAKLEYENGELEDEDTVVQRKQEISFEEISDEDKQALSESEESSDGEPRKETTVVSSSDVSSSSSDIPHIVIGIWHLSFNPGASVLMNPSIQMLYVEYRFLDYPLEEMETPCSLPKPFPPDAVTFAYKKVFPFDPRTNLDRYNLLSEMFNPDAPEASWIKFTIVCEPPSNEEDAECEDVGYAYVDLRELLHHKKDVVGQDIIVYDAKEADTEIGKLNVTVEIFKVLQYLQRIQ